METIFLRPLRAEDAPRMLEWMKDPSVTQYLRLDGENKTLADMQAFIRGAADETKQLHRAISFADGRYEGTISLKNIDPDKREAEYAITLHPDAMGTGAARAASQQILKLAFEQLGLARVYLNVLEKNARAVRLYERLGFRYLHTTAIDFKGNPSEPLRWYEITPEIFKQAEE